MRRPLLTKDEVTSLGGNAASHVEASEGHQLQSHDTGLGAVGTDEEVHGLQTQLALPRSGSLHDDGRILPVLNKPGVHLLLELVWKLPGHELVDVGDTSAADDALHTYSRFRAEADLQVLHHLGLKIRTALLPRCKLLVASLRRPDLVVTILARRHEGFAEAGTGAQERDGRAGHHRRLLQHVALRLVVQSEDAIALRFKVVHQVHLPHSQVLSNLIPIQLPSQVHKVALVVHDHAGHSEAAQVRRRHSKPHRDAVRSFLQEILRDLCERIVLNIGVLGLVNHALWGHQRGVGLRNSEQVETSVGAPDVRAKEHRLCRHWRQRPHKLWWRRLFLHRLRLDNDGLGFRLFLILMLPSATPHGCWIGSRDEISR
mmetsp:Transcript_66401/g.155644  ORF Transcript_66401/g.155644 Transcript_66401/m.155644 type:complete len:372 (-) Transcript_66401:24-1139(-)